MPITMYRRLIRKVIAQTYAAYCQGLPLGGLVGGSEAAGPGLCK